jgi:hypothetical protein
MVCGWVMAYLQGRWHASPVVSFAQCLTQNANTDRPHVGVGSHTDPAGWAWLCDAVRRLPRPLARLVWSVDHSVVGARYRVPAGRCGCVDHSRRRGTLLRARRPVWGAWTIPP